MTQISPSFAPDFAPSWPVALTNETPLPYAIWRVLDLVDGRLSIRELALALALSEEQVMQAIAEAEAYAERHQRLIRLVDSELQREITAALNTIKGPIAEIIVEEALEALGGRATAGALLQQISRELEPQQRAEFVHIARERGLA